MARTLVHLRPRENEMTFENGKFWEHPTNSAYNTGVIIFDNGKTLARSPKAEHIKGNMIALAARVIRRQGYEMTDAQRQVAEEQLVDMYRRMRRELNLSMAGHQPGTVVDVALVNDMTQVFPGYVVEDTGQQLRMIGPDHVGRPRQMTLPLNHVMVTEVAFRDDQYTTGLAGLIQHLLDGWVEDKYQLQPNQILGSAEVDIDFYCYLLDRPVGFDCPSRFRRLADAIVNRCKEPEHLARIVQHEGLRNCGYDTYRKKALLKIRDLKVLAGLFEGSGDWINNDLFEWLNTRLNESGLSEESQKDWMETLVKGLANHHKCISTKRACDLLTDLLVIDQDNEQAMLMFQKMLRETDEIYYQLLICQEVLHNTIDECRQRFMDAALAILPERIDPGDGEVATCDELAQY